MLPIPNNRRVQFLPSLALHYMELESRVYELAGYYCEAYKGGYWDFYEAGFMAPVLDEERIHVVNPDNYFEGDLTPLEFGMGVTLIALSQHSFAFDDPRAERSWARLHSFIFDNNPSPELVAFID